jgi:hypothetical protein
MRRPILALSAAAALVLAGGIAVAEPASAPVVPLPTPTIASSNVTHVGTIPLEGVGVSMEVRKVGKQVRAFVSGAAGLSIYDATDPTKPALLGHLPMYNWENEDIAVSADGSTAILTEFQGMLYLHVIDVSNPKLPVRTGSLLANGAHTVVCADKPCNYLYGSEGQTYDIRDRAKPVALPKAQTWRAQVGARSGHNLHQDATGLWIADTSPLIAFRQVNGNPLKVKKVTTGTVTKNTNYQHNNIRPNAGKYVPRKKGESLAGPLRPGELLLGNGESNFNGATDGDKASGCNSNSGAFSTWSMAGHDRGVAMKQIDVLRPVSGKYADGNPAVTAMGCSGHWFTEKPAKDGSVLVAAAWYEHGTRFLKVDPKTGKIRQVGFFQPVRGATSEAFWIPGTDVVWSIDYHSGIDILKFDQSAKAPTTAQIDASWMAKAGVVDNWAAIQRIVCRENGKATPQQRAEMIAAGHAHEG